MKMNDRASLLTWFRDTAMTTRKSPKTARMLLASVGLFLTSILTTPALARPGTNFFCIFKRQNSSYKVVDVYPTTDQSESWACYQGERQCLRDLREGQSCSKHSSGAYGYVREKQRILCESMNGRYDTCDLLGRALGNARLARQDSRGACEQGKNWDLNRDGESIWVDKGCRGVFEVEVEYYKEPGIPPQIEARDDPR